MIDRKKLHWEEDNLFYGKELKMTVFKLPTGFYKLRWPDGSESDDFYNKTWAKENSARIVTFDMNQSMGKKEPIGAAGALK